MGDGGEDSTDEEAAEDIVAYCSICGQRLPNPEFALNYPNYVCEECNSTAVNMDGEPPWHGWPKGEEPDSNSGSIQLAPDSGENPVYIDGIKCWRRYRFGGHIAFRDTFDCDSLMEFYDQHKADDGYFQVYNSPDPPGACIDQDRLLVEKVDHDDTKVRVWGMLSPETGEILAQNASAERVFGPFEEFLELVDSRSGPNPPEQTIKDPARMLSLFDTFGSQAHKPKILYLTPELNRPLSGHNGIVEMGALRGIRNHDVNDSVIELGFRRASSCNAIAEDSNNDTAEQLTFEELEPEADNGDTADSTITIRYELPYCNSRNDFLKSGTRISLSILQEIVLATEGTDYRYLTSLPAVDIHGYRGQREMMTVGIDAQTVQETSWRDVSDQPSKLRELAVTFEDKFS